MVRRVSGRKKRIEKRLNPETTVKNQNMDLNPRYCDRIPPNTGPTP
jgi:hypothetical protein